MWDRLSGACCSDVEVIYGACIGLQSFGYKNIVCIADIVDIRHHQILHCDLQGLPQPLITVDTVKLKLCGNGAVGECWR